MTDQTRYDEFGNEIEIPSAEDLAELKRIQESGERLPTYSSSVAKRKKD